MTCCSKWFRLVLWSVVAAAAGVASPGTAGASEKGTLVVKDSGNVFTADGIRKAEDAFEAVTFQAPTKLAVVTFNKVPDSKRSAFEDAKSGDAKKRFFREWAEEVARSSGKPDVLVFISMEGTHIKAIDDRQTDLKRGFDDKDLHALEQKFVAGFRKSTDATDAAAKLGRHDAALLESVNFVADQLKTTTLPANTNGKRGGLANNAAETKGTSVMTYVCIGIVALLGIWLVVGVVRMMMGGGGGGGGNYGGGGMGGGGGMMGGGGGGLMTGLLGGMLGAVAGNYLYNNFMGGNSHSSDPMGSNGGGYGDSGTTGDTGAGDYSGGGDGGGSDFGDSGGGDSGGGDFGGGDTGGGDFGGGSDFGGGGDSGGGDW